MPPYTRKVLPTPRCLVTGGQFRFGTFASAFETVNPLDAVTPLGFPLPRWVKNWRLKEWQALQLGGPDFFMLAVVYNAKSVGLAQFVLVDKIHGRKLTYERKAAPWSAKVATSLWGTTTRYHGRNFKLTFRNNLTQERIAAAVDIRSDPRLPDVHARFVGFHEPERVTPMVICQPFGPNRALYSHKCLMPMEGSLRLGDRELAFSPRESFMILDDHKGYYPYVMQYDWVTAAGYDPAGRLVGFNLTDNQVRDHHRYNENCLWLGQRCIPLPPIHVDRPGGVDRPWQIRDEYGRVDLAFFPKYPGTVKIDALVVKSDYYGPCGHFTGFILDDEDRKIDFDNFFGMGEKKYIRS